MTNTASAFPPDGPIRPVWTPHDADDVRVALHTEKRRWATFLTAKDLLLGQLGAAADSVAALLDRWHLHGAVTTVRRAFGWLVGGVALVRRGLTTAGVRPGIIWLLSTTVGQGVVTSIAKLIGGVVARAGRAGLQVAGWTARLFGQPGHRLAARLHTRAAAVTTAVRDRLRPVRMVAAGVLEPAGLAMQTVGTLAKARALSELLRRFLPRPWNILARVVANTLVLPVTVRREALWMVQGWTRKANSRVTAPTLVSHPEQVPTPPTAPKAGPAPAAAQQGEPSGPDADKTPSVKPSVEPAVELPVEPPVNPSLQRYPASRNANAKRRK